MADVDHPSPWQQFGAELRRYRESRELGLRETAAKIPVDHSLLSKWETGQRGVPADHAAHLDRVLRADGLIVALHAAMAELDRLRRGTLRDNASTPDEDPMERRAAMRLLAALSAGAAIPPGILDTIMAGVDRATGEFGLDEWERTVWEYGYRLVSGTVGALVPSLSADLGEVGRLLDHTHNPGARAGLLRVSAQLAFLLGQDLINLGHMDAGWRSFRTARRAADASGDSYLSTWIRGREARAAYWAGEPAPIVLRLCEDAQRAGSATGLAPAHEARSYALAAAGDAPGALAALNDHAEAFERLPRSVTSDRLSTWGLAQGGVLWTDAYAHALTGNPGEALRAADRALALYPSERWSETANIRLIQAYSLIRDREVSEGLGHAAAVVQGPPITPARRMITGQILAALPDKAKTLPAARELRALTSS